jgi:hypothetical protein
MSDVAEISEAERIAAVRARLGEIERELFNPANFTSSSILSPNAGQINAAHEKYFAVLRRERSELLAELPKTGEASGQHMVMAQGLRGTVIVRASEPEYRFERGDEHGDDPHWRFAKEMGWNLE